MHPHATPPPTRTPGSTMGSGELKDDPSPKDLEERIRGYLLAALHVLHPLHLDVSLYLLQHGQNARRDPFGGNDLDAVYNMYEERANECRRLWMKLRALSEKQASLMKTADNSLPSTSRVERSSSPLEYQSALDDDEPAATQGDKHVTPMDIDPAEAEQDVPKPLTPVLDFSSLKSKPKNGDGPILRGVIVTPSGTTRGHRRLAPIPKGVKLSIETTRFPVPQKPFIFDMPQQPITSDSERRPLNRTKRDHRDTHSSQDASQSSSRSSDQQARPSTAQTSLSVSPRRNYSSAKEYWEPHRTIRPSEFHMDEDRLFNSLDCLGPPFHVDTSSITHNNTPTATDLNAVYGGTRSLTPKISPEKLASHGFNHWMVPSVVYHPYLPPRPGWPGLMLRSDDELEEWRPEEGTEFRVVVKREHHFLEYIGQYEMVRLGDITGDEWKQQSTKVKNKWTDVLGGGRLWHDTIARIALRKKLGKEPSIDDLAKFAPPENYTALARDLKDDVNNAFCEGEEVIAVWGMKCVGYDFKFEKHLAHSLEAIKPSSSGSAKKRKAITRNDDDAMSQDGDGEKEGGSELNGTPSKRQRIAKGKAKLIKYDWSDARVQDDSGDEDYKPS